MNKNIQELYKIFKNSTGITTDSRNVKPGNLFFALKGENFDGNAYAGDALEKGVLLAVVDDPKFTKSERIYPVEDSLNVLQQLASYHRQQLKSTFIAITGSNGKTTTKELFQKVLSKKYKTIATQGNLNNHIGVPLTLLSIPEKTEFAIIEMGANHVGEIAVLCEIAQPDVGLITNIGKAHLEGFGSFEGVIRAKSELYRYIGKSNGRILINRDNEILTKSGDGIEQVTYGTGRDVDCRGKLIDSFPYVHLEVHNKNASFEIQSKLPGAYNFENILAAVCAGLLFNVNVADIKSAVENYVPSNNRSQLLNTSVNLLILDAYNANPTSMKAAIDNFLGSRYENKCVILGEMLELGEASVREHQELASYISRNNFDRVFLVGENFSKTVIDQAEHFESVDQLVNYLKDHKVIGKTILIKGSRKNKLEQIIPYL